MKDKLLFSILAVLVSAMGLASAGAGEPATFRGFDDQPIISFYQTHGMVEGGAAHTDIAVYADGKVIVRVPNYLQGAGVWQYQMSPKKLNAIVTMLESYGVMSFDSKVIAQKKTQIQRSSDIRYAVVDETKSTFVLNFSHYGAESEKDSPLVHTVEWPQVNVDAKRFPQLTELSLLARAEKMMSSLVKHERYNGVRIAGGQ